MILLVANLGEARRISDAIDDALGLPERIRGNGGNRPAKREQRRNWTTAECSILHGSNGKAALGLTARSLAHLPPGSVPIGELTKKFYA